MQEILKYSLTGAGLLQHAGCLLGSWAGAGDAELMALVSAPALGLFASPSSSHQVVGGQGGGHIRGPDRWQQVGYKHHGNVTLSTVIASAKPHAGLQTGRAGAAGGLTSREIKIEKHRGGSSVLCSDEFPLPPWEEEGKSLSCAGAGTRPHPSSSSAITSYRPGVPGPRPLFEALDILKNFKMLPPPPQKIKTSQESQHISSEHINILKPSGKKKKRQSNVIILFIRKLWEF